MGKIIAVSNHKGGTGKTTSTINLGAALARLDKRTLLVDLDPQANATQSLGVNATAGTIYDALRGSQDVRPVAVFDKLDIIPSTLDLSGAEVELISEVGREFVLKSFLQPLAASYDYILIDCPPSLGLLTINAFAAADHVYIPLQSEYLALQGMAKLIEVLQKVKKKLNPGLEVAGVFLTQFDNRRVLNREIAETVAEYFPGKVLQSRIRDNVALAEAPSTQQDIFRYAPQSYGAADYLALAKEITQR